MHSANHSSPFPTLITVHDAITDSPIYRANVVHWDEQLDLFDKWLATLSNQCKQYLEKLNRFNSDTAAICEKLKPPSNMDDSLIASSLTTPAFNRFSVALQSTIACQTKMILDIQTTYIEPLHQLSKTYLKDFKEFRKQHDKALDRYESQLQKYAALGKSKDPIMLRDEAELLHDARKEYIQLSGQHTVRVVNFRGLLANLLVERIATSSKPENNFEDLAQIWNHIHTSIAGWRQWLIDDQQTCIYELRKMQLVRERLEAEFLKLTEPRKELSYYTQSSSPLLINGQLPNRTRTSPACKWGYLFLRVSRHTWARRWCFVYNEYFGWCTVSSKPGRAMVTVEGKVSMATCDVRLINEGERRFCFEIKHPQGTYLLQSETTEDLRDWIYCLNWIRRTEGENPSSKYPDDSSIVDSFRQSSLSSSETSLSQSTSSLTARSSPSTNRRSYKAKSTTTVTTPKDIPVTLSTMKAPLYNNLPDTTKLHSISGLIFSSSRSSLTSPEQQGSSSDALVGAPSAVAYVSNSLSNHGALLMTCLSLSPVLVWEAARSRSIQSVQVPDSLWGVPWPILGTMLIADKRTASVQNGSMSPTDKAGVLWPLARDSSSSLNVDIANYEHQEDNDMLRKMFGGVKPDEVVLDVFVGVLRRKQEPIQPNEELTDTASVDSFDKELCAQLATLNSSPPSELGYGYGGKAFVTQSTFWFYSFTMIACVNTLAIKLTSIENIRVMRDPSINTDKNHVLVVDLVSDPSCEAIQSPLVFSIPNEEINVLADKLRFAINNSKHDEPMQLRNIYAKISHMSQSQRNRSTSLLATDQLATTPETKKKRKRLSFRALGSARPVIAQKKAAEQPVLDEENNLLAVAPVERNMNGAGTTPAVIDTKKTQVATAPPPPPPPSPPIDPDELPSHIKTPKGPLTCDCDDHLDRLETELEFPISAKRLYDIMFSDEANASPSDGGVWLGKATGTDGHDLRVSCWYNADGQTKRTLKYIMPVSNPIVRMNEAEVVETQVLHKKEDHCCYVVQISTRTAALPYADAFIPSVRYCITWVDKSKCKLTIHLGVAWVQRVLVRAIVTRAAMKGMSDSIKVFIPVLEDAADVESERVETERNTQQQKYQQQKQQYEQKYNSNNSNNSSSVVVESLAVPTTTASSPVELVDISNENNNNTVDNSSNSSNANTPLVSSTNYREEQKQQVLSVTTTTASRAIPSILQTPVKSIATQQLQFNDTRVMVDSKSNGHRHQDVQRTTLTDTTTDTNNNMYLKPPSPQPRRPSHRRRKSNSSTGSGRRSKRGSSDRQLQQKQPKRRIVPIRLFLLVVAITWIAFGLWKATTWFNSTSSSSVTNALDTDAIAENKSTTTHEANVKNDPSTTIQASTSASPTIVVDRKGVYLRDLEEQGILYSNLQPPYADSESFQLFLEKTAGQNGLQGYRWSLDRYRQIAFDLDTSRDRIAILRHDLLMMFKLLNKVDLDLRESQYMNWLLDSRNQCHINLQQQQQKQQQLQQQEMVGHQLPCQEIIYQLDTYFFYKNRQHINL
ncbi:hypothetical protein BDA99DRAFT_560606 [Phascolomyces articulosus]|uniref:Uncharacterized protein n=1 Tax=Phascolomyces articulosus TaxID=60185 RepID=A0AAD5PCV9_9FUNG|nr:hypothetical protein BDA99DRAFT_560606 [Phascolomyces articulosus]